MKRNTAFTLLIAGGLFLQSYPVEAWDGCGHKTVATIAFDQLSPQVKKKINAIFKKDKRSRHLIDAATWPDDIKFGEGNDLAVKAPVDRPWHFVDIPFSATQQAVDDVINNHGKTPDQADPDSANVVTAIGFFTARLQSGHGDATTKADALSWLIHLVGDIHQPLHCVTVLQPLDNYTPPPKGDLGGNGFALHHPAHELHAFWDDLFDEPTGGRHGEGRDSSDENAKSVANDLEARIHPSLGALAVTEPANWARESYAFRHFVYNPKIAENTTAKNPAHTITDEYLKTARADAEERLVLAGDRLAKLLESIYGSR